MSVKLRPTPFDISQPSANYQPGDWFYSSHGDRPCPYWDNCDGRHVWVVLPGGDLWNSHWRASNCTMKEDRLHRCWVLHGLWPDVTADKNGLTCAAGAGSIVGTSFHGFLRNGVLA